MLASNISNSVFYRLVSYVLVVVVTTTSTVPIIRELPRATAAYLGMMQQLGLLQPDPTSPTGFRSTAPAGMEGLMPSIGPDGEPVGFLLNADALEMDEADFEPPALAEPISVSRAQSAYAAADAVSDTLTITFTVTNNRPPVVMPQLPVSATITDTIEAISAIDFFNDPNAVHNVLLADDLVPENAAFVAASPMPDRLPAGGGAGDSLAWNLGHVPPLGSVTATLTVEIVPGSVADFTELDTGATAWGTLQGRAVSAAVAPASLAPDGFEEWLVWTVDADYYDEYMLQKAAELGGDWQALFGYVRGLGYESYKGSLRGTRGTLWSEAGNSPDQASLLIALLRGNGIPARYRHGTLSTAQAQELILSMFPEPTGTIGHIPAGTEVADPANDPQLLEETLDHWWVEAYLPGVGWTDLDPCFANAQPGQTFHESPAGDGSDRIAEVPDSLRHKVTMTVKVEHYHPLYTSRSKLEYSYPLSHTFNTVELVGEPVTLGHIVNSGQMSGATFWNVEHAYTPYFAVGDFETVISGDTFQELLSNFPFGTFVTTAEWLLFDVHDADGNVEHYEREIVDRIGFESRSSGGTIDISASIGLEPILGTYDLFTVSLSPSKVSQKLFSQILYDTTRLIPEMAEAYTSTGDIDIDTSDSLNFSSMRNIVDLSSEGMIKFNQVLGLSHLINSDAHQSLLEPVFLLRAYPVTPRIVISSFKVYWHEEIAEANVSLDLLKDKIRPVVNPGQSSAILYAWNAIRGITESAIEGQILDEILDSSSLNTAQVFDIAREQEIPIEVWGNDDLGSLADWDASEEAKARVHAAIAEQGRLVVVPSRRVKVGQEDYIAWWEIDPETGELAGLIEDGQHGNMEKFALRLKIFWCSMWVKTPLLTGLLTSLLAGLVSRMIIYPADGTAITDANWKKAWDTCYWILFMLTSKAVPTIAQKNFAFWVGYVAGGAIIKIIIHKCPPIQEVQFAIPLWHKPSRFYSRTIYSLPDYSSDTLMTSLPNRFVSLSSSLKAYKLPFESTLIISVFSAADASLLTPDGVLLGDGTIQASPFVSYSAVNGDEDEGLSFVLDGKIDTSLYAPALPGLAAGTDWLTYTAELTSTQPYTLTLTDAVVTVDDTDVYTGDFTLVVTGTTVITGSGHTAAPNFAGSASMQATDARITLGPSDDTVMVGGDPLSVPNGLALAGYTGPITITEETAELDRVELDGEADFFTLNLSPESATTDPVTPVTFQVDVSANFDDTYTTTVEAPAGWDVALDGDGTVTATPPLGAQPGEYTILVTVQSGLYPDLFLAAEHTVTTTPYQGLEMDVAYDELITVPMGEVLDPDALPGDTNDGRAQVPQAAYTVAITNTATTSHTFTADVDPAFPTDWLILSGGEGTTQTGVTLPAGGVGQVGLYVAPAAASLLPPGTSYPFTVTVTAEDDASLSQVDTDTFTMPAVAFNYLEADPPVVYASPGTPATFDLHLTNVGNAAGTFEVTTTPPITAWTSSAPYAVTLDAGARDVSAISFTPVGASLGDREVLRVSSPAPSSAYTQTEYVAVQIAGPCVAPAYRIARIVDRLDDVDLENALYTLSDRLSRWELDEGDEALQESTVAALRVVIDRLRPYTMIDTADLEALADDPTVAGFCAPLGDLEDQIDRVALRYVVADFDPGYDATLPGQPITYTLRLQNRGTLTTTYRTALELKKAASQQVVNGQITSPAATFDTTLTPKQAIEIPVVIVPEDLGWMQLGAHTEAIEDDFIQAQARAGLKVVDAYVRVLSVDADPPFVETGVSSTTLSVQVANVANVYRDVDAQMHIHAPDGSPVWTGSAALGLQPDAPRSYSLGDVETSGWEAGVYTVTVSLLDAHGVPVPGGSGHGYLAVGQGLHVDHSVDPGLVAPGTVTVTTRITTEVDVSLELESSLDIPALPDADAADPHPRAPGLTATLAQSANPFTRYEEDELTYTGSWSTMTVTRASGGYAQRTTVAGDTAQLTFSGVWVHVGFATEPGAGSVDVHIDGEYQGSVDTASITENVVGAIYADLGSGTHTLSMTTQSSVSVTLDFVDVWNGTAMATGHFEDDDAAHVHLSGGGSQESVQSTDMQVYTYTTGVDNAWFLFTGDVVRYEGMTAKAPATADLFVDGFNWATLDLTYDLTSSPVAAPITGLGSGPHVLRAAHQGSVRLDGLDTTGNPFAGVPMVEWWDSSPNGWDMGIMTTIAAGDLDGNGSVEIAVTSVDGHLYVYNGDGSPGDSEPYLWRYRVGPGNNVVASGPTLADLDGEPGAEILVNGPENLYALHHRNGDLYGDLYWSQTGLHAGEFKGGPAVANLDDDASPEIVVSSQEGVSVLSSDGTLEWQYAIPVDKRYMAASVADLTGDGYPDIMAAVTETLYLFDYARGISPTLVWTRTVNEGIDGFESPAFADVFPDNNGPEVIIAWNGGIEVLDEADGSLLGYYATGGQSPGPITIADTDGDGQVNIITSVKRGNPGTVEGRIYVLIPQEGGTPTERLDLLWSALALDTTSGTGVSVHDLDGDGSWEVLWNGYNQGLTVYDGSDGTILFNEPEINSRTGTDYPIAADVDGDGHAEIVTGEPSGIYVVGHDAVWAPARPLWNEYSYRVTNIADDLSVPPVEPPSWLVHNTYRTQVPAQNVLPVYQIDLTHTVPISGMVVLSDTFSHPPDTPAPAYHWRYDQPWYEPLRVTQFDAQLPGLQPGEVRRVSESTELVYRLASGSNRLSLPPLYATAAHIVALTPPTHTTTPGGQVEYQVTLRNPAAETAVYTLTLAGLPEQWATVDGLALPAAITVDAQTSITLPLVLSVPDGAEPASHDFALVATTPSNVVDSAQGQLIVADALKIGMSPMWATLNYGGTLTYTVVVTNLEATAREYMLTVTGLKNSLVDVPATIAVSGNSTATVSMTVTALEPVGQHLVQVSAGYEQDGATIRARKETVLHVLNEPGVSVALAPATAVAGPASPAIFAMTITNTGSVADTYTLTVELPAGWEAGWRANQLHFQSLPTTLSLTPHLFNAADLHLALTPPAGTPPGTYPVTLRAYSSIDAGVFAQTVGYVEVVDHGVAVSISPAATTMHPQSSQSWDVTITNTGGQADTFDLTAGGIISPAGSFSQDAVTLAPGASTVVQFTAHQPTYVLAQTYPLGVLARSRGVPKVFGDDVVEVTFLPFEDVAVSITPTMQTLTDTMTAHVLVAITNTGNVGTVYTFDASATPSLAGLELEIDELYIPPHMTAQILVTAHASREGTYTLTLQATSEHAVATGTAQVTFGAPSPEQLWLYLPLIMRN